MLVDANLLLFAVDEASRFHDAALEWLTAQLNGPSRVGLPWLALTAFLRIVTHPRALERPLDPDDAWAYVTEWLAAATVWVPRPTERHAEVLGALVAAHQPRGNLVTDAQMAALAIEHWAERVRGGHRLRAVHRNPMGEPDRLTARSVRVFDFARKAS